MEVTQPSSGIGGRIRAARRQRGMTQDSLALAVGVSRSAVAQWETGRADPDSAHLQRISATLDVSFDYLLRGNPAQAEAAARTGDEIALLRLYREIGPGDRAILLQLARRLHRELD